MTDRVTILLTLKGREDFNARWIDYHARVGLPWRVVVGDGAPTDGNRSLWSSASGLEIAYHEFNDASLADFYRKLRDLTTVATTPYVMLADNDDFIVPDGVRLSAEFLDEHPDYVSAGGLVLGMAVTGRSLFLDHDIVAGGYVSGLRQIYQTISYDDATATERVVHCFRSYVPTWYALHRRDDLLAVFEALARSGIEDFGAMELFVAAMLAARGRQNQAISHVNYIRQLNSSSVGAKMADMMSRLFEGSLVRDVHALVETLAGTIGPGCVEGSKGMASLLLREITDYHRRQFQPITRAGRRQQFVRRYAHTARAKLPFGLATGDMIEMMSIRRALHRGSASPGTLTSFLDAMSEVRAAIYPKTAKA
jgi:glycosyltransferase domain-containing protein